MDACQTKIRKPLSEETKRKISEANKGKHSWRKGIPISEEHKRIISESNKGRKHTEEERRKMSISHIGKTAWNKGIPPSKETRKKISQNCKGYIAWNKGIPWSEETKRKISKAGKGKLAWNKGKEGWNKGIPLSEETKKKISESAKGRKHTEETKRKLREIKIKHVSFQYCNGLPLIPTIGKHETECLNEIEKLLPYKILRNKQIIGYFIDGYIKELNIVIEFDESFHYKSGVLKEQDLYRQQELIKHLKCEFFRIKQSNWINDKQKILEEITSKILQENG